MSPLQPWLVTGVQVLSRDDIPSVSSWGQRTLATCGLQVGGGLFCSEDRIQFTRMMLTLQQGRLGEPLLGALLCGPEVVSWVCVRSSLLGAFL